jgi:hypothetical protein
VGAVLVLVVAAAACEDSNHEAVVTQAEADAAAAAGTVDAAQLVGGTWEPPGTPERYIDPTINDRCVRAGSGLGASEDGLVSEAVSAPFFGWSDPPGVGGNVRTAVRVYESSAAAEAAVDGLGDAAFERCLIATTNRFLHKYVPVAGNGGPMKDASADSFETKHYPVSTGYHAMLAASTFYEEVIGGFDNTHVVALLVARSGPVVVTAMSTSDGQLWLPKDIASMARSARRLGVAALARATAALAT